MHRRVSALSLISLIIGALIVGTAPIFVRYSDVGAAATAFWRLGLAGVALLPFLLLKRNLKNQTPITGSWQPIILAGFCFALDMWVWNASIMMIPVAKATLYAGLAPIHVALYMVLVLKQKMRPMLAFGCVLALTGAAFLASPAFFNKSYDLAGNPLLGNILGFIGGVAYAGYVIAVASGRKRLGTLEVMCLTSLIGAAFTIPPMLFEGPFLPQSAGGWASVLALALIVHVIGQGLIAFALANLPVLVCSLGLMLQPVSAAIAGWILFGEIMGGLEWFGAALVIIALVLVNLPPRQPVSRAGN